MKKVMIFLLLSVFMLSFSFSLSAVVTLSEGFFCYSLVNDTATILSYTGKERDIVIPSTVGGYSVNEIGDFAFCKTDSIYSVTLPESVNKVGDYAFFGCRNLSFVVFEGDRPQYIGTKAFTCEDTVKSQVVNLLIGDNLTLVPLREIPEGVEVSWSVLNKSGSVSLIGTDGVISALKAGRAFVYADYAGLRDVFDVYVLSSPLPLVALSPESIVFTGSESLSVAFNSTAEVKGTVIWQVVEPIQGLYTEFSSTVINGTSVNNTVILTSVPDGTYILRAVFVPEAPDSAELKAECKLKVETGEISPPSFGGIIGEDDSLIPVQEFTVYYSSDRAGWQSLGLTASDDTVYYTSSEKPPYSVKWTFDSETGAIAVTGYGEMPDYSTVNMPWYSVKSQIRSVALNGELTNIGSFAFSECSLIERVILSENTERIGDFAFEGCTSLSAVRLYSEIESIGYAAFNDCENAEFICDKVCYASRYAEKNGIKVSFFSDINRDGGFNLLDIISACLMSSAESPTDDFNGDGTGDGRDVVWLFGNLLRCQ